MTLKIKKHTSGCTAEIDPVATQWFQEMKGAQLQGEKVLPLPASTQNVFGIRLPHLFVRDSYRKWDRYGGVFCASSSSKSQQELRFISRRGMIARPCSWDSVCYHP
jgi:hypothetical protein